MNIAEVALSVKELKEYAKCNPDKFKHKYGDIDLDSIPDNFPLAFYKGLVTKERIRRDMIGESQEGITPDTFDLMPKKVKEVDLEGGDSKVVELKTKKK